jgi:RNA polymerase sigma-70 factor, ECF subfamily
LPKAVALRMAENAKASGTRIGRDALYEEVAAGYGSALGRLARAYEPDPDKSRDLLQEIQVAIWRSLERFDGRCSLRTWVYRVAHNTATSQVLRRLARAPVLVSLEDLEAEPPHEVDREQALERRLALAKLLALIQKLKPLDRQVILLYLEGMDAAEIGEVSGLSPGNVATKVHRIKSVLASRFAEGEHRVD